MQTNTLQLPNLTANAVAAPKVNLNLSAGGDNNAFKQALSREMDQRQANSASSNQPAKAAERPNASRASAPKQQAAPAKQQNDDDAPAPQASSNDSAAAPAPAPAKTASSSDSSSADSDNSDAQAAQAADPVADMLALVAAFNQPAAAATPLPAADAG
ncbi:flagellar hook-length control protein FliK, partial [Pseudoduganella sp. FT26W]|nr:flagellar hook-length control protein FliK [Duganella aquatilis]